MCGRTCIQSAILFLMLEENGRYYGIKYFLSQIKDSLSSHKSSRH